MRSTSWRSSLTSRAWVAMSCSRHCAMSHSPLRKITTWILCSSVEDIGRAPNLIPIHARLYPNRRPSHLNQRRHLQAVDRGEVVEAAFEVGDAALAAVQDVG